MFGLASVSEVDAQVTSVPPVVFSSSSFLGGSNSKGPSSTPDYSANIGRIASNQRGDAFAIFTDYTGSGYNSLIEVPAGTNTQILIAKNVAKGVTSTAVTVDSYGNLWFLALAPDGYDNGVDVIPFVNGSYATGIDLASTNLPPCSLPIYPVTTPCQYPNIVASNFYGYLQLSDVAVDSTGNLYVVDWADSNIGYDANAQIVEYDATTGADAIVLAKLPAPGGSCCNGKTYGRVSVAPNGDIYYVDQANLYYSKQGSGTFSIVPGFNTPSGVSVDYGGSVYVTDSGNNRIAVLPNINGVVNPSNAYAILSGAVLGTTPYYSVGIDGYGTITYPGTANSDVFYRASVGGLNLGSVNVGTSSTATDLDLYFTAAETYGSLTLTGAPGTPFAATAAATNGCVVGHAYAAGATCSLSVTYTPSAAGPQSGTLQVYSQGGALLGTASLSGSGIAPLLNVDPGTVTAIGSGWKAPSAIAVDGAGNTYVADSTTGSIYKNGNATAIATGFNSPSAVVVDGAGNLYVGDSGNSQIVEVPYSGTAYGTPVVIKTGLSGPSGLAIDGGGNLYVADSGHSQVLLLASGGSLGVGSNLSPLGASVSSSGTVLPGFTAPVAVAADNLGNVYVADSGSILQVGIKSGVTTPIAQGLKNATAVAVDPAGDLYYVDSGAGTITRVPNVSGTLSPASASKLSTIVATPSAIAIDSQGNLYAADATDAKVAESNRAQGTINFGPVVATETSESLTATLSNEGTSSLTLGTPYDTVSGSNTADFVIQSDSTCADGGALAGGASCTIVSDFTPSVFATETDTLSFAGTGFSASLSLTGVGKVLVNVTFTGSSTAVYGTAPTYAVTATLDGTYPLNISGYTGVTPQVVVTGGKGSVTLPVLDVGSYTIQLAGTVGSTSLSVTPATLNVIGVSVSRAYGAANPVFTATVKGAVNGDLFVGTGSTTATQSSNAGTYPIVPSVSGPASANYTIVKTNGVLTITQANSNTALAYSSSNNGFIGGTVTFTATVTTLTVGAPTGTVTFVDATNINAPIVLGTGTLDSSGKAAFQTSSLIAGTIYVQAIYSGDVNFITSSSIPTAISTSLPSFMLSSTPQTTKVVQGQSVTVQINVTPVDNFSSPVVFSCSGLPLEASCSFASPSVTPSGGQAGTDVLTIKTVAPSSSAGMLRHAAPWKTVGGTSVLALMIGSFAGFRKKRFAKGLCLFFFVSLLCLLPMTGCGLQENNFFTPLGIYNVTITGACAANNTLVTTNLRLAVYTTATTPASR
jgi:sugar lactone lactonase YvrE